MKSIKDLVPAALAIQYTVERARESLFWLEETQKELQKKRNNNKGGYLLQLRSRILADIISVYISTLIESTGKGHSLQKSYFPNNFIKKFVALSIVKKCLMNRQNRSAHESKKYGHFVSPKDILSSNLKPWLEEINFFIATTPEKK